MRSPGTVSKPETCVSGRFRPSTVMKDSLDLERLLVPLAIAATFSVAASFSLPAVAFAASFRGLGVLPGGEYPYSKALDISADGSVVVSQWPRGLPLERLDGNGGLGQSRRRGILQ